MNLQNLPSPAQLRALADWIEAMEGSTPKKPKKQTDAKTTKKTKLQTEAEIKAFAKAIARKALF